MTLLLIRHGETSLNVIRTLQPADTPLNERGIAQASALARRLATLDVAGIISSDIPRAAQTAARIGLATGRQVAFDARLRERDFGALCGTTYDSLSCDPLLMEEAPPGGESLQQFHARVALAFETVCRMQLDLAGPLVVVSHGLVIRAMLERHARCIAGTAPVRLRNGSLSIVAATTPHAAELVDCTHHLDDQLASPGTNLSGG